MPVFSMSVLCFLLVLRNVQPILQSLFRLFAIDGFFQFSVRKILRNVLLVLVFSVLSSQTNIFLLYIINLSGDVIYYDSGASADGTALNSTSDGAPDVCKGKLIHSVGLFTQNRQYPGSNPTDALGNVLWPLVIMRFLVTFGLN